MPSQDPSSARDKIIESAGQLFADLGYEIVSVREIASVAGVHFSAINYHFGSKDNLYRETLRVAATAGEIEGFVARHQGNFENADDQLRELADIFLKAYLSSSEPDWSVRLLAREFFKPSSFAETLREIWSPPLEHVGQLMARVKGWAPDSEAAKFRSWMFFLMLDSICQSRPLIEAYTQQTVERDQLVAQVMELFTGRPIAETP